MDDFYKECSDRLKDSSDPASTIDELHGISIHDLPRTQLCKFAEQAVTLISIAVQTSTCPTQERIVKFQAIRRQLDLTLTYLEQIMEAEKAFPCVPQEEDCWW